MFGRSIHLDSKEGERERESDRGLENEGEILNWIGNRRKRQVGRGKFSNTFYPPRR